MFLEVLLGESGPHLVFYMPHASLASVTIIGQNNHAQWR